MYAGDAAGANALWAGPAAFFFAICGWMEKGLATPGERRCCAAMAAAATASLVMPGGGGSAPPTAAAAVPADGGGTALYWCTPLRGRGKQGRNRLHAEEEPVRH